jgi:hypothetical protein
LEQQLLNIDLSEYFWQDVNKILGILAGNLSEDMKTKD